ncbi:MAG: peptidase M1 [Flavobacterium sp. BFFFF2]|nr:MAG: peptidase M1 [Flavobacterium sp. BFFFF2]
MRNYIFIAIGLLIVLLGKAQSAQRACLIEAETKRAKSLMSFMRNANTQNYDVTYHKLEFTVNPAFYHISGKVTTTFTAINALNQVVFDLSNQLAVSSVKMGSVNLNFTQNASNELVIILPTTVAAGNSATVIIQYAGAPPSGQSAFTKSTHNNTPIIWTLSEPFGARDWWPCKQDLNDKVEQLDIYITAPAIYVAVANGVEPEAPVVVGSNKTTHFHHSYPIPAYLVAIAVTNYAIYNQTAGTSTPFPIVNYIYPEELASVQSNLNVTPSVMNVYENLFEPYPFRNEKYGHAQFGWGGGMEHTTVSFMVGFSRELIAHELAHQWFGDKITCGSWKDIWLNEGFATYLASMVIEQLDGVDAFIQDKTNMINSITLQPNGAVYLTDAEATSVNRIFSSRLTYDKGAMVLEMLRFKLGDTVFFQAIKNYLADTSLAYKYANTSQLQAHLEAVYGQSLFEFFNDWVYNQGYPMYTATVHNQGGGMVEVVLSQTPTDASVSFFEMPVPLRFTSPTGETFDATVEHTQNEQVFNLQVPFEVYGMEVDPDKHLISKNNFVTLANPAPKAPISWKLQNNPVHDQLQLVGPDGVIPDITIFNPIGQKVGEQHATSIDVSHLQAGCYLLKIQSAQGEQSLFFVKGN